LCQLQDRNLLLQLPPEWLPVLRGGFHDRLLYSPLLQRVCQMAKFLRRRFEAPPRGLPFGCIRLPSPPPAAPLYVNSCYLISHVSSWRGSGRTREKMTLRTVTRYHPSPPRRWRHTERFKAHVPGHTRKRPRLIQSGDDLYRSTHTNCSSARVDFHHYGGTASPSSLGMTRLR
jgi:hypothetical protein